MRSLSAAATYFGLVFGAGFVLGAIRVPFLVPRLGERAAELAEMPVMFVVIVFAARFVVRRFGTPPAVASWLSVGILALAFLVGAELALATKPRLADAGRLIGCPSGVADATLQLLRR
jgi:hypothetical protein